MPIEAGKIHRIPGAVEALRSEFQVLWETPTWKTSTVQETWQAEAEAKRKGIKYTFVR